jgi:tetratricopeptide (TPR) repeat protein
MPLWGRMLRRKEETTGYDRAVCLFDEGKYEAAITEFEAVLSHPRRSTLTDGLARFYLGEAYAALAKQRTALSSPEDLFVLNKELAQEATTHLRQALSLHPQFADLHFRLGCALIALEHLDEAREAFERALELNPNYADARRLYAATLEGQASAEKALIQSPSNRDDAISLHSRLALSLYHKGEFEAAADSYRQALSLAPSYADLHNQLGVALHAADRDDEALQAFTRALEINPRYIEARLNRAIALRCLGREKDAQEELERILELDPKNAAARDALSV